MTQAVTSFVAVAVLVRVLLVSRRESRAAGRHPERIVWRLYCAAALVAAGSALAAALADVLIGPAARFGRIDHVRPGDLIFELGTMLACALCFQASVCWNEIRLGARDPGQTMNALGSVLIAVAVGSLLAPHLPAAISGQPELQLQLALWTTTFALLASGTAIAVAVISELHRDQRSWLIIAMLTAATAGELVALVAGNPARPLDRLVWVLALGGVTVAARIRPARSEVSPAAAPATITGALFVLLAGAATLTVNNLLLDGGRASTVYAALAVLGASVRMVRLTQDLAHLARTRHQAMTDELTGIANRRALLGAIDQALATAVSTSLLILDLDRFKAVNDRFGHAAGDRVLRHMTKAFAAQVPRGGVLARLGGDEFAVLLTDVTAARAVEVAQALAQAAAPMSDVKGRLLQVGASVGVATIEGPQATGGELLRRADAAMYQAKTSGSGVRSYDSALDAAAQQRLDLVEDLHVALEGTAAQQQQIVVFFQPQLSTTGGTVTGAEALVRWQHPRHGLLAPDSFIDLAEANGLMPSLTARVLGEAARYATGWRAAGHDLRVSVNLSAACLEDPDLLPLIDRVLTAGLPAATLVLEVTETSLMLEPERALASLRSIAGRGVGISIDDYGTGYSSLAYLNDLPATELKIDRSFTARTAVDSRTAAIVGGTVELAHRLGMRLVAEGVEDEVTLAAMTRLGCDETQGYLHSRPLPAGAFLDWLRERTTPQPVEPGPARPEPARPESARSEVGRAEPVRSGPGRSGSVGSVPATAG